MSADDHLLPLRPTRPDWWDLAECRGMNPNLFFPTQGEDTTAAKAVCAGCPVRERCLTDALTHEDKHGIFGGTSERERRRLRRTAPRTCRDCGTGIPRRTSRGGQPVMCPDCKTAARARSVEAWTARRATTPPGPTECPLCPFVSTTPSGLAQHRRQAHKGAA